MLQMVTPFALVVLLGMLVSGQQDSFEVASVKPNAAVDARGFMGPQPGGRFVLINGTAVSLITVAYDLTSDDAIIGLPDWVRRERYDVNAKVAEGTVPFERIRLMLRALLADRFSLQAHVATQEQPTYALVLARPDRRLGPNIRPATKVNCDELMADVAAGKAKWPPLPPTGPVPACMMRSGAGTFHSGGSTMKGAATMLYPAVRRVVIDKTGLEGYYELELDFAPLPSAQNTEPSTFPSIFTAIEEQLGLKLTPERNPVPVLVIDRIERPTPD